MEAPPPKPIEARNRAGRSVEEMRREEGKNAKETRRNKEIRLTTEDTESTEEITKKYEPQMGHKWTQMGKEKT
jgi:hypothetical protein